MNFFLLLILFQGATSCEIVAFNLFSTNLVVNRNMIPKCEKKEPRKWFGRISKEVVLPKVMCVQRLVKTWEVIRSRQVFEKSIANMVRNEVDIWGWRRKQGP